MAHRSASWPTILNVTFADSRGMDPFFVPDDQIDLHTHERSVTQAASQFANTVSS